MSLMARRSRAAQAFSCASDHSAQFGSSLSTSKMMLVSTMTMTPIFPPSEAHDLIGRELARRGTADLVEAALGPAAGSFHDNISRGGRNELDFAPRLQPEKIAHALGNGHLAFACHLGHK